MSVRRRWSISCDDPDCDQMEVLLGDQFDGKWQMGTMAYEAGWQVAPNVDKTYCPKHKESTDG